MSKTPINEPTAVLEPDEQNDCAAAIQAAMDARMEEGGGVVQLKAGVYRLDRSLHIPTGVTLQGACKGRQYFWNKLHGTVLHAYAGRGSEAGEAVIEMGESCALSGLSIYYPEQRIENVVPYPPTIHIQSFDQTVTDVILVNSYDGIRVGPEYTGRHTIRDVGGTVLRRGLSVDMCSDIGRVENVHWHDHWWASAFGLSGVADYMGRHLEAFTFRRTDWEYVYNTFVYPCRVGYRFAKTEADVKGGPDGPNGNFLGIGADLAQVAVLVENAQFNGLAITNGEFVGLTGDAPVGLRIEPTCGGTVRLSNCSFWGDFAGVVESHNPHVTSLDNCVIQVWGERYKQHPLIAADAGKLQVRGCSFATVWNPGVDQRQMRECTMMAPTTDVELKKGLTTAIITGNTSTHGVQIINAIGSRAIINDNEPLGPRHTMKADVEVAKALPPPSWIVRKTATAASGDAGKVNWSQVERIRLERDASGYPADGQACMALACDEEFLYVRVEEQIDASTLCSAEYRGDRWEVFFGKAPAAPYFQICLMPDQTLRYHAIGGADSAAGEAALATSVRTTVRQQDGTGWCWEMALPLDLTGNGPELSLNVLRGTPLPIGPFAWSPVFEASFHSPARMGRVVLSGTDVARS